MRFLALYGHHKVYIPSNVGILNILYRLRCEIIRIELGICNGSGRACINDSIT